MDVRCDNCGTLYELDEARLKPGGVTVKCTQCGHLFRVHPQGAGAGYGGPQAPGVPGPPADPGEAERIWLVRLEDGEIRTCRELATLQQWIVANQVSRACEISRTGKTWKRLGEIAELASFFNIADEARLARAGRSTEPPRAAAATPVPAVGDSVQEAARSSMRRRGRSAAYAGVISGVPRDSASPEAGRAPGEDDVLSSTVRPGLPTSPPPGVRITADFLPPSPARLQQAHAAAAQQAAGPVQGKLAAGGSDTAWTGRPQQTPPPVLERPRSASFAPPVPSSPGDDDDGPTGPVAGVARTAPTDDAAFVSAGDRGKRLSRPGGDSSDFPAAPLHAAPRYPDTFDDLDEGFPVHRTGRWIALFSLLLIGGAVAAFLVITRGGKPVGEVISPRASAAQVDAGAAVASRDAQVEPAAGATDVAALQREVETVLGADVGPPLEALRTRLLPLVEPAIADGNILALAARVELALAQQAIDAAQLAAGAAAPAPEAGRAELARGAELARRAVASAAGQPGPLWAVADALRLQGAPAVEVENTLRQAEARMPAAREVLRVRAMLAVREGNLGGARKQFEELTRRARSEEVIEVRPEFRLALLDLAAGQLEAAGKRADAVLASQPMHGGAQALRARITSATQVVASDPMPPEEKPAPPQPPRPPERPAAKETPGDGKAPAATRREPPPAAGEESYDVLLARGNAMAEAGNCREARVSFRKALDARPNGVEALTGLGYCHLDIREYVLAHARFRAALGIAPRYQEALWGMAETYERQGNAERALEAYERYLDAHPSGPRSDIARRQIERLKQRLAPAQPPGAPTGSGSSGGGSSGSGGSGSGSSGSGGSGSGSSEPSRPPASGGGQEGSTPPEARPDPTAPRVEVPDKKEAPPETLPPGESRSTEIDPALPSGEADKPARRDAAGNTDDPALPREEPGADEPAEEPAADEPDAAGQTTL